MKKDLLSLNETTKAAMNIKSIENMLGHEIPPGAIDVTELGDDLLSLEETTKIAMNIESIEYMRKARNEPISDFEHGLTIAFIIGFLAFVVIMMII